MYAYKDIYIYVYIYIYISKYIWLKCNNHEILKVGASKRLIPAASFVDVPTAGDEFKGAVQTKAEAQPEGWVESSRVDDKKGLPEMTMIVMDSNR